MTHNTDPAPPQAPAKADRDGLMDYRPIGKNGTVYFDVTPPGEETWTDTVNLMSEPERKKLAQAICERWPASKPAEVRDRIEGLHRRRRREIDEAAAAELADKADRASPIVHEDFVPFPVHLLPDPLDRFVSQASESLDCDPSFVAAPLLAAIAGAIGNTRRIHLNDDDWYEPAVVWTVVIGGSSSGKSPALRRCLGYLWAAEAKRIADYEKELKEHKRKLNDYAAAMHEWKMKGRTENKDQPDEPEAPPRPQLLQDNFSLEGLIKALKENPRGLLIGKDELAGFFKMFDAYRAGKGGDAEAFLEMFNAGPIKHLRKGAENTITFVPRAGVSITGGIQPATLARILTRDMFENGMASRYLMTLPDKREPKDQEVRVDGAVTAYMHAIFGKLLALDFQQEDRDTGQAVPTDIGLMPDAAKLFRAFRLSTRREQYLTPDGDLEAAWGKIVAYSARLALLVHLVRLVTDPRVRHGVQAVDAAAMSAGIELAKWFAREARRVYAYIRDPEDRRKDVRLAAWIAAAPRNGRVTVRELQRSSRKYAIQATATAALEAMVTAGQGDWKSEPAEGHKGYPSRYFELRSKPAPTAPTPTDPPLALAPMGDLSARPIPAAPTSADRSPPNAPTPSTPGSALALSPRPIPASSTGSVGAVGAVGAGLAEFGPPDDLTEGGKYASDAAEEPAAGPPAPPAAAVTQNLNPHAQRPAGGPSA